VAASSLAWLKNLFEARWLMNLQTESKTSAPLSQWLAHNTPIALRRNFLSILVDNAYLDAAGTKPGYTVFGQVVKGMDVVEKIAQSPHCTARHAWRCSSARRTDHQRHTTALIHT
jgi:cyclophilin family peptidyl-prolyl cis-trans isomerase